MTGSKLNATCEHVGTSNATAVREGKTSNCSDSLRHGDRRMQARSQEVKSARDAVVLVAALAVVDSEARTVGVAASAIPVITAVRSAAKMLVVAIDSGPEEALHPRSTEASRITAIIRIFLFDFLFFYLPATIINDVLPFLLLSHFF